MKKQYTLKETANILGISTRTIYRMMQQGYFTEQDTYLSGFIQKKRVITQEWIDKFIAGQKAQCL